MEWDEVVDSVSTSISQEKNEHLLQVVTDEEVKYAMFQMHPDKAPGHDGMTPAFFQKHWSIVGNDVILMVRKFFTNGIMP